MRKGLANHLKTDHMREWQVGHNKNAKAHKALLFNSHCLFEFFLAVV